MYQFKFQIPSYFSLVVRSLAVLEGIALSSNPDYKVLGSSYPWIARKVLTDDAPQLRSTLKALLYKDGAFQIDRLESLVTEALRSATMESLAVKEETPNTTRNPILKKILAFILSDDGGFVKETVLEEVAKGLDALARATIETSANSVVSSVPALGTLGQPNLLEENDLQNLSTLIRLRKIMFEGLGESSNVQERLVENDLNVTEIVRSLDSFTDIQNLVNSLPTLAVIFELPVQAQWQALLLPGELVGKLTSRIIARTIRNSVNGAAQDVIAS